MSYNSGNALTKVIIIGLLAITALAVAFFVLPVGGELFAIRESAVSFLLREPPKFVSMEIELNGEPSVVKEGESIEVTGNETLIIRKINAYTFFKGYLNADIKGFGKSSELNEPIH